MGARFGRCHDGMRFRESGSVSLPAVTPIISRSKNHVTRDVDFFFVLLWLFHKMYN